MQTLNFCRKLISVLLHANLKRTGPFCKRRRNRKVAFSHLEGVKGERLYFAIETDGRKNSITLQITTRVRSLSLALWRINFQIDRRDL